MAWAGKAAGAIVDLGAPLASAGVVPEPDEAERASGGAAHVSGFSILEADSAEVLRALLDDHPHFHSPGESAIEVFEFLPMPGG